MKKFLLAGLALASMSVFADTEVVSDGDISPSAWPADGQERVILWADANGNYSEAAPIVHRDEVEGLVASNNLVQAAHEIMTQALDDAIELTQLVTYNLSQTPILFSTPRITSFKLAVVIDEETFKCVITALESTDTIVEKTISGTSVQTRLWHMDFATTDDLQTVTPDIRCDEVISGMAVNAQPEYLLEDLYTVAPISGESFVNDTDTYSNFYRVSMYLPVAFDSYFLRVSIDPDSGAASSSGSVLEIGGIDGGLTYDEELSDGSIIHYENGIATVEGSSIIRAE